jgi:hypothetical protein
MAEQPTQEAIDKWHRWFAVECNNRAWDLMSKSDRVQTEERDMLYLAYASAFHWSKVGTPLHNARAEVTLAHAHALLGHGEMSLHYAQRCLAFFESNPGEDWDIAFAHAEVAHAAAVLGDVELHARHYAAAKARGAAIAGDEDRRVFEEEFAHIPATVHGAPAG